MLKKYSARVGLNLEYFINNGFWIIIRYATLGVCGLIISSGFTRFFSQETYGQYQYVMSIVALLSIFSLPGFNILALRSVAKGNDGIIKSIVGLSFISSLVALVALVGFGVAKTLSGDSSVGYSLITAGLLFPLFFAPNTWYAYF